MDIFEKIDRIPALCWYSILLLAEFGEKGKWDFLTLFLNQKSYQIKGARYMKEINKSIKVINKKFEEMEEDRKGEKRQN